MTSILYRIKNVLLELQNADFNLTDFHLMLILQDSAKDFYINYESSSHSVGACPKDKVLNEFDSFGEGFKYLNFLCSTCVNRLCIQSVSTKRSSFLDFIKEAERLLYFKNFTLSKEVTFEDFKNYALKDRIRENYFSAEITKRVAFKSLREQLEPKINLISEQWVNYFQEDGQKELLKLIVAESDALLKSSLSTERKKLLENVLKTQRDETTSYVLADTNHITNFWEDSLVKTNALFYAYNQDLLTQPFSSSIIVMPYLAAVNYRLEQSKNSFKNESFTYIKAPDISSKVMETFRVLHQPRGEASHAFKDYRKAYEAALTL